MLGCTTQTIRFWEWDRFKPRHREMAKLIEFLGYNPFFDPASLGEKIARYRQLHGLTQRRLAEKMGVDPSSIWAWETGEHRPTAKSLVRIKEVIGD